MSEGMIDRNGMRGGAAISVVLLIAGYLFDVWAIVAVVAFALGIGSIFGPRRSPLGMIYRALKRALKLPIPVEPEPESPPRFAQTLGFLFTAAGAVLLAADVDGVGWALALIVAALQALLAITGICVGCEIYLLGKRLRARSA